MKFLRKFLGVTVMIAGILGILLSMTGMISIWVLKPTVQQGTETLLNTLDISLETSIRAVGVTEDALGATINSIDALQTMLEATASAVESTEPILNNINEFMAVKLPGTINAATDSLKAAQQGAEIIDGAIRSFDSFKTVLSGIPLIGGFIEPPQQTYNPDRTLAQSLGDVAGNLSDLPSSFGEISANMDKADDNLGTIQDSLDTMAINVSQISASLGEYQKMLAESQKSMEATQEIVQNIEENLDTILFAIGAILTLFFLWLLIAQVVILTQGYELFQGTANKMEG
jgi:methyl-accepting chemotaxis protein